MIYYLLDERYFWSWLLLCGCCCGRPWPVSVLRGHEGSINVDQATSIIFALLCCSMLILQRDVLHGRCRLCDKHIKLPLIFLIKLRHLLKPVHYLRQVPARIKLRLQRLIPLEWQLVVKVRSRMVEQLELDPLHWLDRLDVDDADASATRAAWDFEEEFPGLIPVPQKVKLHSDNTKRFRLTKLFFNRATTD